MTIAQEHNNVSILSFHFIIQSIEELQEDLCCHPPKLAFICNMIISELYLGKLCGHLDLPMTNNFSLFLAALTHTSMKNLSLETLLPKVLSFGP